VSHLKEREEKKCLNCGATVQGRYCHICGQENIEPKESFWHLVTHFAYDVTHFDGKFFSTLRYLLFKPGFLSKEYLRGKRASYLHPIRMYVFTSAFFFLVFFSLHKEEEVVKINETDPTAAQVMKNLEKKKADLQENLSDSMPSMARIPMLKAIQLVDSDMAALRRDTTVKKRLKSEGSNFNIFSISSNDQRYRTEKEYDSLQQTLPAGERDNFIERRFARQNLHLKEKYKNDGKAIWTAIFSKFRHLFPQMMFVSLPLFALLLQLLYSRKKSFFYVNHVVYTIHLYCATFIIILLGMLIDLLMGNMGMKGTDWVTTVFGLLVIFYWYKSMRNFYEQRRGKTLLKYFLLGFLSIFLMVIIFTVFFIFSAMAI
jgi:hypothetical protein